MASNQHEQTYFSDHHKKKQEEKEKERLRQQQLEQEKMQQMMSAAAQYRPQYMSPRHQTPRFPSPRRGMGQRHEPYPVSRPVRRSLSGSTEGSPAAQGKALEEQMIKVEPNVDGNASNQSASETVTASSGLGDSTDKIGDPENMKSESLTAGTTDGGGETEMNSGESNPPSNSVFQEQSSVSGAGDTSGAGGSELDPNVTVKLEALTDDLEITGVEPGRPIVQMPQDNWGPNMGMEMSFDQTGATGSQMDMAASQGTSKYRI